MKMLSMSVPLFPKILVGLVILGIREKVCIKFKKFEEFPVPVFSKSMVKSPV